MRRAVVAAALALALAGCVKRPAEVPPPVSAPPPPPPRAAPVSRPPAPAARPVAPAPKPPPVAPAPAPAVPPEPPAPSPPLAPALSPEEERRLAQEAERKIAETERVLREVQGRSMKPEQQAMIVATQGLLEQARQALAALEYQRAAILATKARALGGDVAETTR